MLFLLWSLLSTCLESESKSVRSKKFSKNFKFPWVKFWKTNSNEERTVKEVLSEQSQRILSLLLLFWFYFLTLRAWLWGKKNDRLRSKPVQGCEIILQSWSKKVMGRERSYFFSRYRPPSSDRARVIFPLAYFIIATSLLVVSLEQSKCPLRMKGWIVKQSAFKCELPSCRLNSFINLWSFYT